MKDELLSSAERLRQQVANRERAKREGHIVSSYVQLTPEDALEIVSEIDGLIHDLGRVMTRENNFLNELERIKAKPAIAGFPECMEAPARAIAGNKRGKHPHSIEVDRIWHTYVGQAKACILAFLEESAQRQKAEPKPPKGGQAKDHSGGGE